MKSELLRKAMMAKYQDGGKVKKEPKKVASESELPKGGVWETDASGKKFYVVRSKDKTKGDKGDNKYKTYSGTKKKVPTNWKIDPTKSETEEKFYLEPPVTTEPAPDPFNLAFGWAGAKKETTNEGVAANMPRVLVNGKPTQIREWTVPGQFDEKTKTWNTASGAMNPTKVYGYYGSNNEFIPVDVNKTQKLSYDPTGKPYYDPKDVVAPPAWTTAAKTEGSLRALDSEAIKKTQLANEEQRKNYLKSGITAPQVQVKEVISPTNFNESGLSIGKDVELKTKAQGIVPTQGVNTPVIGQYEGKLEPLVHPKFKSGGLVKKYASGGPILNNALGQLGGAGVDALDRRDGVSSIAGQAGSTALKGAGQGAAIGSAIPGVGTIGGAVIGGGIGFVVGGMKGKKEKKERMDATAEDIRNNVVAQQYSDSKDTFKSDLYNEKDYRKGLKGLFAKGGTIKGKGTGTSDSIETKMGKEGIEENSFIVPAKNNGLAKLIRRDILGDSPSKEAKFKKGGNADMAVSNGEHLFTPAEKKKITAYLGQEILEKLAPEAEENEDKKCGGLVGKYAKGGLTMSKAKEILRDGTVHGNPLTKKQKGYFGAVAGGNAYKYGGNVAKGTTITVGNEQATWNGTNWVDKTGNKYSASYAKKFEDVISSNQQKEQQRLANQQATKYNTYKRKLAEAKADTKYDHSVDIANYQKFIDEYEGKTLPKVETKTTPKTGVQKIVPTTAKVVPASNKAGVTKPTKKGLAKVVEQSGFEPMTPKEVTLPVAKGSDLSQFDPNSVTVEDKTGYDPKTGMFKSTVSETGTYGLPQAGEVKSKYGLADAIGMGAATLQAGYGLSQLMKDKRPVDRLDPAFNQLTDEAIAASKYGYSSAQRALLNQQITQGRIGQQAQINQLAGGNAAVGLTNARAAINSEMNKRLQMASEDERLRMQKAQYAAGLAGTRAGMSRQLFADKMNEFQQKQAAGAELLGAGISNIVGAARYAQERQAQNQINKMMFGSGNLT